MFRTVLDKLMMQEYKKAIEEEEETTKISAYVLKNWELLVKKGGDTRRFCDALLKDKCGVVVEDAIADFGREHGICPQALTDYVIGALYERINGSDDGGIHIVPRRVTRQRTDWMEEMVVMLKMGILVMMSMGIVTCLISE